jgi:hypothetical protein
MTRTKLHSHYHHPHIRPEQLNPINAVEKAKEEPHGETLI